jgi:hypothetical protein
VTGTETATATYTPNIPQDGFYPVYTWVLYGTDRTVQTYEINHTGGTTEVSVDHSKVGSGWIYLGTYHFDAGSSSTLGSVQISNKAAVVGKVVIADAIRFGNGMGDFVGSGAPGISGYPREDENSYHWIARMTGVGTTLATAIGSGTTNVSAPSNMAQYMFHGSFGEALYVGFHSNAGGGRGAVGLIDADAADQTPHQSDLALYLGRQINQDMQNLNGVFEYDWGTRTIHTYTSQFGEIDLGNSAEMDATIIEVAFHDSVEDAVIMRDPNGRDQLARSTYQGTLEYFATYGTPLATNTSLPTPPVDVRAVSNASGAVTINWAAGAIAPASVNGATATGFRIYASIDGYGFDGGTLVNGGGTTSATLTGYDPAIPYYFRVAAVNAGGESSASEVIAALPGGGAKQVLIVNGFDRFDRTQDFRYAYLGGLVDRVWSRYNNSFDYVVQVETAIQAARPGLHVASTSNEAVISGAVNLNDYDTVIWILGTESTADDTFNAAEQAKVTSFINGGGNLFLSGSEIGWDLDQQNNGRTFYETTLKGNYVNDDAGTYTATANAGSIFTGMSSIVFSNGASFSSLDNEYYNVSSPDVISPQAGAVSALTYSGGTGGTAAIQVPGAGGAGNIVMFGFPFEAITTAANRAAVMDRVLDFFYPNADFTGSGTVDGSDFIVWRNSNGTSVPRTTLGDANGDGLVNQTDYTIWRSQFGTTPGAGAGSGAVLAGSGNAAALTDSRVLPPASGLLAAAATTAPASDDGANSTAQSSAFAEFANRGKVHRTPRTGFAAVRHLPAPNAFRGEWESLLTILVERSNDRNVQGETTSAAVSSGAHATESCTSDGPWGEVVVGQLAVAKAAMNQW